MIADAHGRLCLFWQLLPLFIETQKGGGKEIVGRLKNQSRALWENSSLVGQAQVLWKLFEAQSLCFLLDLESSIYVFSKSGLGNSVQSLLAPKYSPVTQVNVVEGPLGKYQEPV